jgi:hypothetical protein
MRLLLIGSAIAIGLAVSSLAYRACYGSLRSSRHEANPSHRTNRTRGTATTAISPQKRSKTGRSRMRRKAPPETAHP